MSSSFNLLPPVATCVSFRSYERQRELPLPVRVSLIEIEKREQGNARERPFPSFYD